MTVGAPRYRGTLEKAFGELRNELTRRPEMAWIPLQGILRIMSAPAPSMK